MDGSSPKVWFYWRPGCGFCAHLRRQLDRAGVSYEAINIWDDPKAAATVRSAARGNETVPTVIVGSRQMVNPTAREVMNAIEAQAPGSSAPAGGGARRRGLISALVERLRGA